MSKPRADSKLKSMPREWQDTLCEWLTVENVTYSEARKRLIERFEVSSSQAALSEYYSSAAVPWKYARARNLADEFAKLSAGQFDQAAAKRLQQLLFEMTVSNRVDLRAVKTLAKIVGDSHKLTLAQQRLELDTKKFREQVQSDIEKGLDALHAEIKGNAEALQLFERMKSLVMRSVEGKP